VDLSPQYGLGIDIHSEALGAVKFRMQQIPAIATANVKHL
jgi:hypothetical protein